MSSRINYPLAVVGLLLVLFALGACAPDPQAQLISPDMVDLVEGESFVPPTVTPEPRLANLTDEQIYAGLPAGVASAMPGSATSGEALAVANGCLGCHQLNDSQLAVAPSWANMGDVAVARAQQLQLAGPAEYLYQSIVQPNVYIVEGYNIGVMPQTYGDTLSEQDLADIITYLLSQQAE